MKETFVVILLILLNQIAFTQIHWVKSIGGQGNEWPLDILIDDFNNVYFSANFQNSIDVDPSMEQQTINASLDSESFVLKVNKSGEFIKVDHLIDEREGLSISRDEDFNIYYLYSTDAWSEFRLEKRNQQGDIINQKIINGTGRSSFQLSSNLNSNLFPLKNTYCNAFNTDNVSLHNQELNCISDKYSITDPEWKGFIAYGAVTLKDDLYYFTCEINGTVLLNWGGNVIEIGETDFFNDTFWKTTTYIITMNVDGELVGVTKINEGGMQDPSQTNQNLTWSVEEDDLGNVYLQNLLWGTYTYGVGEFEKTISSIGGPAVSNSVIQKFNKSSGDISSYLLGENANFTDLIIDQNNNIILSGIYASPIDLDLKENSNILLSNENSINNSFIVKYNSEFDYLEHAIFNDIDIHKINQFDSSIYFYGLYDSETLVLGNETLFNNGNSDLIFGEFEFGLPSNIENHIDTNVSIFPNPFQGEINIKSQDSIKDVSLFDIYGRKQDVSFDKFTKTLNTNSLASGQYILVINTGNFLINKVILKNEN